MALHALSSMVFWLAMAGVVTAYVFYMVSPGIPVAIGKALSPLVKILENKYYLDWFNENVLSKGARLLGTGLWKGGDQALIDGVAVNGSARLVGLIASVIRLFQSGYIYHYALVMLVGVVALMTWFVLLHA
jgi:NADH-quinone oxidoreductase subunit L